MPNEHGLWKSHLLYRTFQFISLIVSDHHTGKAVLCKAVRMKSGNCFIIEYYNDICQHGIFACVYVQIKFLAIIVYSPNILISPYNKFHRRQMKYLNNVSTVDLLNTAFYLYVLFLFFFFFIIHRHLKKTKPDNVKRWKRLNSGK